LTTQVISSVEAGERVVREGVAECFAAVCADEQYDLRLVYRTRTIAARPQGHCAGGIGYIGGFAKCGVAGQSKAEGGDADHFDVLVQHYLNRSADRGGIFLQELYDPIVFSQTFIETTGTFSNGDDARSRFRAR